MGVKYVRDFEFPASAGFHSSNMPSRAGMSSKDMPSRAKPNAPARGAARMESGPKMGKGQGYAKGGKVEKFQRGGPSSREATGPTSGRATYIPNPFGKRIKVYTGPTGGRQPRVPTRNPRDIFGNINPDFNEAMREAEETRALEEMRMNREPLQRAKGGKVGKHAKGGMMSKGPATRGTPAKGRAQGRMEFAEKYAPGLSLDMPGKRVKKK